MQSRALTQDDALAANVRRLPLASPLPRAQMIGTSAAMHAVRELLARVATSDASLLLTGEHGTGKEVAARFLHAASTVA